MSTLQSYYSESEHETEMKFFKNLSHLDIFRYIYITFGYIYLGLYIHIFSLVVSQPYLYGAVFYGYNKLILLLSFLFTFTLRNIALKKIRQNFTNYNPKKIFKKNLLPRIKPNFSGLLIIDK